LIVIPAVLAGGCARTGADPGPSGLFDVGGGRQVYLDCQGTGAPTVFIIPGKGSYAQAWNYVVPPDDPIRSSPYDIIIQAKLGPSPTRSSRRLPRPHRCAHTTGPTRGLTVPTGQRPGLMGLVRWRTMTGWLFSMALG
jgi:hypothetical protein